MSKKSSYFRSKKGFSLLELLCAVVIMAMVVSATATGLAVSYKSIMLGSVKDKASAKAQEFCDIIMTYIEHTPSNHPDGTLLTGPQNAKNLLFKYRNTTEFTDIIKNGIWADVDDGFYTEEPVQLATPSALASHTFIDNQVVYLVESKGTYSEGGNDFVSYQVTVYLSYENGKHSTSCTGSIVKPKYAP